MSLPLELSGLCRSLDDPLAPELVGTAWESKLAEVLPAVAEHSAVCAGDRRSMQPALAEMLQSYGLTRLWTTKDLNGEEASLRVGIAVLAALASVDASVSWQLGVQGAIGRIADYLPVESAEEVFGRGTHPVVGSVNPTGRYVPVEGGYILSGRWSLASGERHAK